MTNFLTNTVMSAGYIVLNAAPMIGFEWAYKHDSLYAAIIRALSAFFA